MTGRHSPAAILRRMERMQERIKVAVGAERAKHVRSLLRLSAKHDRAMAWSMRGIVRGVLGTSEHPVEVNRGNAGEALSAVAAIAGLVGDERLL